MTLSAAAHGRQVLREEVKEFLIEAMRRGELRPGDRIVETRVARQLGVSQAPVREALRDLELFGFVVSSPFRGTRVRRMTKEDIVEVYPIRAALEGVAARTAAARIDESALANLDGLLAQMREAAARGDERAHVDADIEFHRVIIEASGNRLLKQVWDGLRLATTTFLTIAMTRRPLTELAERHEPLLAALRAHDPIGAEAAMRHHIEEPGEWILAGAGTVAVRQVDPDGAGTDGTKEERESWRDG